MKTSMSSDTKLMKDEECESVDSTKYRGMIGIPSKDHCSYSDKWSLDYLEISCPIKVRYQTNPPSPSVIKNLIQTPRQGFVTRVRNKKTINDDDNEILNREIQHHMSSWVEIIRENVFCLGGHRDHVPACLCHILYCIETSKKYNLAFFILKLMESIRNTPKEILPNGMLLTTLFTYIVSNLLESSSDRYILCDRVMHPVSPHYERMMRSDHGTKRCRSSNPNSSFNVLNHLSSSHHINEINDGNDKESFHSNTPSLTQLVSSLSNIVPRVFENPPHENQTLHSYQTKILNHQSQHQDEHRKGLRSIGNALKNDVIENGNLFKPAAKTTTNVDGTSTTLIPGPVTTGEMVQKKNDIKARSMLLMALPNEHLMTFNQYKDAKTLFAAIQTRFGSNEATKKTQKTLLNQMYENFSAPSTESLDSIFNRLQKIVSQLAILSENISQDLNLKFFRSLPSEWNTHVVVWRNKHDLDTMSFIDRYNNFKIVEQEVKGTTSSSSNSSSQNMAFMSSLISTNEVNTTYEVGTANTQVSPASTQVSTASTQVSTANLNDDTVYAFLASQLNGSQLVYEDLDQIHEDDIEKMDLKWQLALLSMRTRRGPRNHDSRNRNQDSSRRTVNVEETSSKAMLAIDGAGFDWSHMVDDEVPTNVALMAFSDFELEKLKQEKESNQLKIKNFDNASKSLDKLIGSQIPDKSRKGLGFVTYNAVPPPPIGVSKDTSNEVKESLDAPMVEKLVSDDKLEKKNVFPTVAKIEFVRPKQQEKLVRKPVKYAEMYRLTAITIKGKGFMKTGLRSLNTVRPVNTAHPKTIVYSARPMSHFSKSAQSIVKRPYQTKTTLTNKNSSQKVNTAKGKFYTARPKVVNTVRPNSAVVNDGHPQKEDQGYVDSGCSRHMTGNMSYLSDFKEFDEGHVTFGGGAKGGKITGKGTLKTGKLDFEDVYFVKELQFNLFTDKSQVLLKVPRKNNMYSVDMMNIVPKESLTYLVAKATLDESML
ncbi:hypothetical protein Tco_0189787 [Tanacetum coccineum]